MASHPRTTPTLVTADELLRMGAGRRELIHGEVVEMSPAGGRHGEISLIIAYYLARFVLPRRLGKIYSSDTGFLIERGPDHVRAPDVSFVRRERVIDTDHFPPLAPDLAVEVISPGDTLAETLDKAKDWLAHGTVEVWIAQARLRRVGILGRGRSVGPRWLEEHQTLDGGRLLPGFRLPLRRIFDDPPPRRAKR